MEVPTGLDLVFIMLARNGEIRQLQTMAAELKNFPFENLTDPKGWNALHWAAVLGKTSVCRFLIEALNFNVNAVDEDGETPLFKALAGKCRPTAIFLLDSGADVSHRNTMGETPLHFVADRGTVEMVKLLISKGADVCATSERGMPLHYAAKGGKHDVLEYILGLTSYSHPNIPSLDLSPLFSAMFSGSIECVNLLLKAGVDSNYQCYHVTPLRFAATQGYEGIIKCLLKAGADANVPDYVGYTPLDHAALLGFREVVELLFPHTSRIASYPDWSVNGVMQHAKSSEARTMFNSKQKEVALLAKTKGREAFDRKKYSDANNWFVQASHADPLDTKVLSNLSLCSIKMNYGHISLRHAQTCIQLEPKWVKGHYREGTAYMHLKAFKKAAESFSRALALEPGKKDIEKAHRDALASADKFGHWDMLKN